MDTYLRISYERCQKCGLCVEVCGYLEGGRNIGPSAGTDNMPCRGCDEPCKEVCYYKAIDWERY